jgi:hypothetical protein
MMTLQIKKKNAQRGLAFVLAILCAAQPAYAMPQTGMEQRGDTPQPPVIPVQVETPSDRIKTISVPVRAAERIEDRGPLSPPAPAPEESLPPAVETPGEMKDPITLETLEKKWDMQSYLDRNAGLIADLESLLETVENHLEEMRPRLTASRKLAMAMAHAWHMMRMAPADPGVPGYTPDDWDDHKIGGLVHGLEGDVMDMTGLKGTIQMQLEMARLRQERWLSEREIIESDESNEAGVSSEMDGAEAARDAVSGRPAEIREDFDEKYAEIKARAAAFVAKVQGIIDAHGEAWKAWKDSPDRRLRRMYWARMRVIRALEAVQEALAAMP